MIGEILADMPISPPSDAALRQVEPHRPGEVTRPPADVLAPHVISYTGFEVDGLPPGVHMGLPGRSLTLLVSLAEPLDVTYTSNRTPGRGRHQALAGGLTARSVAIRHDGHQRGVRVALTPAGSRAILAMPAAGLAAEVVALEDVLGRLSTELVDRLRACPTWPGRFAILDDVLTRRLDVAAGARMRPEVAEAWRRLVVHRGRLPVGTLAAELGWSRRHLGERFRDEVGLSPKTVARVLRFEHACSLATKGAKTSWADIAATAGYADQAHLVREWRSIAGCTPTEWLRHDLMATPV